MPAVRIVRRNVSRFFMVVNSNMFLRRAYSAQFASHWPGALAGAAQYSSALQPRAVPGAPVRLAFLGLPNLCPGNHQEDDWLSCAAVILVVFSLQHTLTH